MGAWGWKGGDGGREGGGDARDVGCTDLQYLRKYAVNYFVVLAEF